MPWRCRVWPSPGCCCKKYLINGLPGTGFGETATAASFVDRRNQGYTQNVWQFASSARAASFYRQYYAFTQRCRTIHTTLGTDKVIGDTVNPAYASASFADKNVGTSKTVSASGISISGLDAGNYNLLNTTATTAANITARPVTASISLLSLTYSSGDLPSRLVAQRTP